MENEEIKVEEVKEEVPAEEVKVEEIKEEPKAPKKGKGGLIAIIVIGIILLIAINVVVALILINNDKNKNNTTTTTTVTTTEKTVFKVTFNSNGGDSIQDIEVKKDEKVTLPTPKKEGAEFLYWSDEEDVQYNETTTFDKDTNLTANWKDKTAKTMKITFDSKGGSKVSTTTYTCDNDGVTIKSFPKNPTKSGYLFRAWEDKNGKAILVGAKLTCEDLTLYAAYDKAAEEPKCPDGYDLTATDTLCVRREDATEGCDITHEKEIDGKCYSVRTYKQATCKVQTGSTGSGSSIQPILSDGKVIYKDSNEAYCVYGTANDCDTAPERKVQGICYEKVEMRPTTTVCSSDQKYLIGNQLYGTKEKGTGASTGCYTPTDKHKICPEKYNYNEVEGKCISSVKPIGWE